MTPETPEFQIGFPLDDRARPEFVIVCAATKQPPTHRWFRPQNKRITPDEKERTADFTEETGAGRVLRARPRSLFVRSYDFYHVGGIGEGPPKPWHGESDGAACALALAKGECQVDASAPVVLISVACHCGRGNGSFQEIVLKDVSFNRIHKENVQSLVQKWNAALAAKDLGVKVVSLILLKEDSEHLEKKIKQTVIPLTIEEWKRLRTNEKRWPALLSIEASEMPLLARALGCDTTLFTSASVDGYDERPQEMPPDVPEPTSSGHSPPLKQPASPSSWRRVEPTPRAPRPKGFGATPALIALLGALILAGGAAFLYSTFDRNHFVPSNTSFRDATPLGDMAVPPAPSPQDTAERRRRSLDEIDPEWRTK